MDLFRVGDGRRRIRLAFVASAALVASQVVKPEANGSPVEPAAGVLAVRLGGSP